MRLGAAALAGTSAGINLGVVMLGSTVDLGVVSAIIIAMAGGLAMWSLRAGSGAFLTEAASEPSP